MKKTTFLKKVVLVCLLVSASVAQSCLMAQLAETTTQDKSYSSVAEEPHWEGTTRYVTLTITPVGNYASPDKVTLHKGQKLVINGAGTPTFDPSFNFKSITVKKKYWHLVYNVLTSDSPETQTDPTFSFTFNAYTEGKEKLAFDVISSSADGSEKLLENICPIHVTVKK
jgi:hypothetical protein